MNRLQITWTIFTKELLDTLRDRRTLFMMVGMPVLLYPALIIVSLQVMMVQQAHLERKVSRVVVDSPWPQLRLWLQDQERIKVVESEKPEADLHAGEVDVVVQAPRLDAGALEANRTTEIELLYDATEFESNDGARRVEDILYKVAGEVLKERLALAGLDPEYVRPLDVTRQNVAPPAKATGSLLGLALPLLMVMMIALGAFYPAVDLTAGEKERGTFETLLSTPARVGDIVMGKFLAVAVLAMATGLLNLISMAATVGVMIQQLTGAIPDGANSAALPLEFDLPWSSVIWVVLILVPFSGLISALMMSIAVVARSFKDAQNYVTPFLLVLIATAGLGLLPSIELTPGTALAPVLNVVVLFRALMTGSASLLPALLVLVATTLYAAASLGFASWLFHREDVVLGDQTPRLFSWRRPSQQRDSPTAGSVLVLYAALVATLYYASLLPGVDPIGSVLILQWGLLLLPTLAFLWWNNVRFENALSLRMPPVLAWHGALLLCVGAVVLLMQLGIFQERYMPAPAGLEKTFKDLFSTGQANWGILGILFAVAITPAICEEIIFRGVMLSGLRNALPKVALVIIVGLLFGAFHASIHRLLPTALIGIMLSYVCLRTGSIFPGMLMHALSNGIVVLLGLGIVPAWLMQRIDLEQLQENGMPAPLLLLAAGCVLVGFALIEMSARYPTQARPRMNSLAIPVRLQRGQGE